MHQPLCDNCPWACSYLCRKWTSLCSLPPSENGGSCHQLSSTYHRDKKMHKGNCPEQLTLYIPFLHRPCLCSHAFRSVVVFPANYVTICCVSGQWWIIIIRFSWPERDERQHTVDPFAFQGQRTLLILDSCKWWIELRTSCKIHFISFLILLIFQLMASVELSLLRTAHLLYLSPRIKAKLFSTWIN